MGLILDTSILIATERERFDLETMLGNLDPAEPVGVTAISASEFLHGIERAKKSEIKEKRLRFVELMLSRFQIHPFGLEDARIHAAIWARLEESGGMIGAHDLLIAATCLHLDAQLATLNTAEFSRVPGLKLVESAQYVR